MKIKGLDGLRAISVMLVIISHGELFYKMGLASNYIALVATAHLGVNIFFVLSGFLITFLLIEEEKGRSGLINLKKFYARRALRIFPLYFLAITFILILFKLHLARVPIYSFFYVYTYLSNFVPNQYLYACFSHFWSLAVEEHFYLIWPLIFCLGRKLAFIILCITLFLFLYYGSSPFAAFASTYKIARWTMPAALPIIIGCIGAYFVKSKIFILLSQCRIKKIACFIIGISVITLSPYNPPILVFNIAILLIITYIYASQDSYIVSCLEFKPLAYLGIISYGLYIWQGIFTGNGPYRIRGVVFPLPLNYGLFLTFLIAPISYHFFELPFLKLKKKFNSYQNSSLEDKDSVNIKNRVNKSGISCSV